MNKTLSTVGKIRTAFARRNLLATTIGMVKGGAIPAGTFALYHLEMGNDPWQAKGLIVLGGLAYSAKTVYGWCKQVFRTEAGEADRLKALGWCVGIEGFMTCSSTFWLNCCALALLVLVNAIATGVGLVMEDEATREAQAPERDVDAEVARAVEAQVAYLRDAQAAREAEIVAAAQAEVARALESRPVAVAAPSQATKVARVVRTKARRARKVASDRASEEGGADASDPAATTLN